MRTSSTTRHVRSPKDRSSPGLALRHSSGVKTQVDRVEPVRRAASPGENVATPRGPFGGKAPALSVPADSMRTMAGGRDQLTGAGGSIAGVGATFAAGYWIYAMQANKSLWAWPMMLAGAALVVGICVIVWGLFARSDSAPLTQVQRGGQDSRNYQAGRDISLRDEGPRE